MASAFACLIASGSPRQVHPSNRTPRPPAVISGMGQIRTRLRSTAQLRFRRASLAHDSDQITARLAALVPELNITRRAELQAIASLEHSGFTSLIDDDLALQHPEHLPDQRIG